MTQKEAPKMSLAAQYDDLCRATNVLTEGSEEAFKMFIVNQLDCLRKWNDAESQVRQLTAKIGSLEAEKNRLSAQMRNLKSLLEDEIIRRKRAEEEKKSMERQVALIKDVLLADGTMDSQTKERLGFLGTVNCSQRISLTTIVESFGSVLDISEDCTGDGLDNSHAFHEKKRSKGKRSSSEGRATSPKTRISKENTENVEEADLPENEDSPVKNRCNSEPSTIVSPDVPVFLLHQVHKSDSDQSKYTSRFRSSINSKVASGGTPLGRYSTGGKLSRMHMFACKTVIRTEKCYPCGRLIKFFTEALKCQDCRVICHPECKEKCPVPCIPTVSTPTRGTVGKISDYVASTSPMIPSLIVHCVSEIEVRGLQEIGLYRISGSEREVKDLKEKFLRRRTIPCLNQVDINAICGLVKEFLRSLEEPLVTRSSWKAFIDAAELSDKSQSLKELYDVVASLPQANRDTLSFLILHLQRIAESPDCKMPKENLAKVFGPTIVGYSVSDPACGNMLNETGSQFTVMLRLLEISADLWQNLLNFETDMPQKSSLKTPENIPVPRAPRLGPYYTSGQKRCSRKGRSPFAQRNSKSTNERI